jgi:hypothetical protein
MNKRERDALDRHITGNYGEGQFKRVSESKLYLRADNDPTVIAALREGRHADDIYLVECINCGAISYYNQGSHAECRNCKIDLSDETDEAFTLADYWEGATYPCDDGQSR